MTDYNCELIIEDYAEGRQSSQTAYFKFSPKSGTSVEPFIVEIDAAGQAKNLVLGYSFDQGKFVLGEKQELKMQTTVKLPPRPTSNLETIEQSEDEVYPDEDMEIRFLELGDE